MMRAGRGSAVRTTMMRWGGAMMFALLFGTTAAAQDSGGDKMRDFNTDRPTKSNVPYTVDAGHFQYEGDLFLHSFDGSTTPDTNISAWTLGNPTFKVGVLDNLDLEANISAFNSIQSTTRSTGASSTQTGVGDLVTRAKLNLFGNEGGTTALAVIPFIKWPTAPQGIGN